jgi:hypothetical protein
LTAVHNGDPAVREVIIGRNSRVWRCASLNPDVARKFAVAIGHADVSTFKFSPRDRVWVFSYGRRVRDNSRLLGRLVSAGVTDVVYVSSAATVVARLTSCYRYPRVKLAAEEEARRRLRAHVLTLGLVVERIEELPPGRNAATMQAALDAFLLNPSWPHDGGIRMRLFETVAVPFQATWEARLHRAYDTLQWAVRWFPCLLRPIDVVLRLIGIRWYGYVNLSNRLWTGQP